MALDVRIQNFHNGRRTVHLYVDMGFFIADRTLNKKNKDDRAGVRLPIGLTFGLERNIEAFIQAVPSYDFNNDNSFNVDGAFGIRYRF